MSRDGTMTDRDRAVAALLLEYASKPPNTTLSRDEKKELAEFVIRNKTFRKLKSFVRMQAWQRTIHLLNSDAQTEDFKAEFTERRGFRDGMLYAIDLLEEFVTEEDEDDG